MLKIRKRMDDYQIGDKASFTKTISETDVYLFAGISGDFYPLHINEELARKTRFNGRIVHGVLTASLISTVLGVPLQGPGVASAVEVGLDLRFIAPVRIGDTITAEAEVIQKIEKKKIVKLKTTCKNQKGEAVITGTAAIMILENPEKLESKK